MKILTKPFRLLYSGKEIHNADFRAEQSGRTCVADSVETAEFDTLFALDSYVATNGLKIPIQSGIECGESATPVPPTVADYERVVAQQCLWSLFDWRH